MHSDDVRARIEVEPMPRCAFCNPETCGCPDYRVTVNGDSWNSGDLEYCALFAEKVRAFADAAHADLAGEVREWRSIENPPSVSTTASHPVLVYSPEVGARMGWYTKAYADKGEWPWSADGFCELTNQTITYWMPRPEPPAALAKLHPTHQEKP